MATTPRPPIRHIRGLRKDLALSGQFGQGRAKAPCRDEDRSDMPIDIKMPALSPTMEVGRLAKWLVKEGDEVHSGDILAEIETDKATMEFEAVDEGTVASIAVAEGTEGVKVGTVIATLSVPVSADRWIRTVPSRRERTRP